MPEVEELKRRARRAESDGELREALEIYRDALRVELREGGDDAPDPGLVLRVADLHADLDERDDAVDAYRRAAERYAERDQGSNAVAVCRKVLRVYPDATSCHRVLAELQIEMGLMAEARESLMRYLEAAEDGDVDVGRVLSSARSFLEEEPDQEVCLRAARILERDGRTGEALDLLQAVWEKRTGRRRPAGEIEAAARRLDPDADLRSWRPEWPPVGGGGGPGASRVTVEPEPGGADREPPCDADPGGAAPAEEGAVAAETHPRDNGAPGTAAANGHDDGFVRRYDREAGGRDVAGDPEDERPAGDEDPGAAPRNGDSAAPRRLRTPPGGAGGPERPPAETSAEEADEEDDRQGPDAGLRRGLEVLEELLDMEPGDPELRRRKIRYARRLGDDRLLEEALTEMGDLLARRGATRGARLVYGEVLGRLDPRSEAAEAGLRRVEGPASAVLEAALEASAGPHSADTGSGGASAAASDVDRDFRRRVSEAMDRLPGETAHLQAAGLAATGRASGEAIPWWGHRELGRYLLLRGRPEPASRHLATAHERAPPESEAAADLLYHLGVAHRRAGERTSARDCFRELAERDSDFAAAWAAVSA